MKRVIILLTVVLALLTAAGACADPARTDGTVTAWIGENNAFFLKCEDGITRTMPLPMKDILCITETEVTALSETNQLISVKKDGSGYAFLNEEATEEKIAELTDRTFLLEDGKLTSGETVYSERAAAAASDGNMLYWINRGENTFVLMQKELPGKTAEDTASSAPSLTGISVPEPIYLNVTDEALTLTAADRTVMTWSLKDAAAETFAPSGMETTAAVLAGGRLYRYVSTETMPWVLEDIRNDALQLATVTPAPTATPSPTPVPTATPRPTPVPTATPRITATPRPSGGGDDEDGFPIYKWARGSRVRSIQRRLQNLGYPVGYVDGTYGEQTQLAVELFYDAVHLREHQYISERMYEKLFARSAPMYDPYMPLQKGDRGRSVIYLQVALLEIGLDPGKLDGIYGKKTVQAVADYQRMIGYIPAPGEVPGEYAASELLEKLYDPDPIPTATLTDLR